jgi:cytochrome c-type biogenesis protein
MVIRLGAQEVSLFIAFAGGLLSFFSPCVLPMVPSYLAFITGVSLGDLRDPEHSRRLWRRTLFHSLMFVAGFSLVFVVLMGGSVSVAQAALATYRTWVYRIGGVVIILLGLHFTGLVPIKFLDMERRFDLHKKPLGYLGSLAVGLLFALGWTPCIGPVLASIILVAAASKMSGFALLAGYSAGLAIPFLLASVALHLFFGSFERLKRHFRIITLVSGLLLALIGVLMVTGAFQWLVSRAG